MGAGWNHNNQVSTEVRHSIKLTKIVDSGVAGISAGNFTRYIGQMEKSLHLDRIDPASWSLGRRSE